ncbi:MAG TPA: metallophosphoesterase [Saprospiraceae bacterium]|nr:metallophosphoesterase [Saprospiraceae bacterium]HMQ84577.1 metallophosphoesterase [Saprospiraceae bacterium]
MRFLIPFALLLIFDWYVFQAFRVVALSWQGPLRQIIFAIYWTIPIALFSWMLATSNGWTQPMSKGSVTIISTLFFIVYISKMVAGGVLLIDDFRRLITWGVNYFSPQSNFSVSRSKFLTHTALVVGSLPFISLLHGIIRNPYRYKLFSEKVLLPKLPPALQGLKIVQISDIHSGSFLLKEPIQNAIDLINEQKPDLIFFTGDLVNSIADEVDPYLDLFGQIKAKHGVYSVLGNHDYGDYHHWNSKEEKDANLARLKAAHEKMGWRLLMNENELIDINGHQVAVIGVENYSAHLRFPKYGDLTKAYAGAEAGAVKLLLSHDPSHWEAQVVSDFPEIDITFSGHTHGMQFGVEIPGWFKWSPIKYVYKQWAGLYQNANQYLYVNRGLGYLGYPGRVGILPEVTLIELQALG